MIRIPLLRRKKTSTKVVLVVLAGLIFLMGYFTITSYLEFQAQTLLKLEAIAKTLALQVNGDEHQYLIKTYKEKGAIKTNEQDSVYHKIQQELAKGYTANNLQSEIATLYFDSAAKHFSYVVNSSDTPYYLDPYEQFHKKFYDDYTKGGTIEAYTDEYGTWLTAFSPIKNKNNVVVGILEVDEKYDDFLHVADVKLYRNMGISLVIFIVVAIMLLRYVRFVLVNEEEVKRELEESYRIIQEHNKDVLNSLNYAKKIQTAILPPLDLIRKNLPGSFVLYSPKDIVSGDFYFFHELKPKKRFFIATCDCTGHGVPGALMSMIGNNLLDHIIPSNPDIVPAEVLNQMNRGVVNALKQEGKYSETRDGMDVSLCLVDLEHNTIDFAGANRPLYVVRDKAIMEYKGDKRPIGGYEDTAQSYTNHHIAIEKGDRFYMFSDGYADQFGGPNSKKFLIKNLQQLLIEIAGLDFNIQHKRLYESHKSWKGSNEQTDDVLVIGFGVDDNG
ncbi:MAG: SpoIIE family protein phosphatase [Bacteroidetes bacterium]|nr:SpoIIE family protein phosphatase [Bacteroidota bacterium]